MDRLPSRLIAVGVGVVAFALGYMFLFPTGCDGVGGVPSWERCYTVMGNPAFSLSDWGLANQFDILTPLAVAVLAAVITLRLLSAARVSR